MFNNIEDMIRNAFEQQNQPCYHTAHDLRFLLSKVQCDIGSIVKKLPNANVIAVTNTGDINLFVIDPNGVDRNVKCYSSGNGITTDRDVVDVFNFIQKDCFIWSML